MSIAVMNLVDQSNLKPGLRWTLHQMANRVNDEGRGYFEAVDTLAFKTGHEPRTVQRHLAYFRKEKLIVLVREPDQRRPAEYRLDVEAIAALPKAERKPRKPAAEKRGGNLSPQEPRGDKSAIQGRQNEQPGATNLQSRGDTMPPNSTTDSTTDPTTDSTLAPTGAGSEPNQKLLGFDDFWNAYPSNAKHNRKRYKGDAVKVFEKLKPTQATIRAMLDALAWQRDSYNWRKNEGQYVPYPTRWLRASCWLDDKPEGIAGGRDDRPTGTPEPPKCTCVQLQPETDAWRTQRAFAAQGLPEDDRREVLGLRIAFLNPMGVKLWGASTQFWASNWPRRNKAKLLNAVRQATGAKIKEQAGLVVEVNAPCAVHPERAQGVA